MLYYSTRRREIIIVCCSDDSDDDQAFDVGSQIVRIREVRVDAASRLGARDGGDEGLSTFCSERRLFSLIPCTATRPHN